VDLALFFIYNVRSEMNFQFYARCCCASKIQFDEIAARLISQDLISERMCAALESVNQPAR